jgi:pyruvate formate lyase activating enzyme
MAVVSRSHGIDRRGFLQVAGICTGCSLLSPGMPLPMSLLGAAAGEARADEIDSTPRHPALFYKKHEAREIECELCPRKCMVGDRERGYCGVRENHEGEYYTLVYGNPCSANIDPIEKKPLFHFHPGTYAFSIATAGCNLNCKFCQNWQISQFRPEQIKNMDLSPEDVADQAAGYDCNSIAYTYSEPIVFYEYMKDCAIAGNERNVNSVMISAGYIEEKPLRELLPHLAAVKIDLKAFTEDYYDEICSGELKPVLDTLVVLKKSGIWFEIVYLMLPTLNDSPSEIRDLCRWIKGELGPEVPVHFTRFHPDYLLTNLPATPIESLEKAYEIAGEEGLDFPYIGNVYGHRGENTYCPGCGKVIVRRRGFKIEELSLDNGVCKHCGQAVPGVWS